VHFNLSFKTTSPRRFSLQHTVHIFRRAFPYLLLPAIVTVSAANDYKLNFRKRLFAPGRHKTGDYAYFKWSMAASITCPLCPSLSGQHAVSLHSCQSLFKADVWYRTDEKRQINSLFALALDLLLDLPALKFWLLFFAVSVCDS